MLKFLLIKLFLKMKLSSKKKFFFLSVFITFIISSILFLSTIKNNIRIFNNNFLNNYNSQFIAFLKKINLKNYENYIDYQKELNNSEIKVFNKTNNEKTNLELAEFFVQKLIPINIQYENFENQENNFFLEDHMTNKLINKVNYTKQMKLILNKNKVNHLDFLDVLKIFQESFSIYEINRNYTKPMIKENITNDSLEKNEYEKISKFKKNPISILKNNYTEKGSFEVLDQKVFIFKHINLVLMLNKDSSDEKIFENKNKIMEIIEKLNKNLLNENKNKTLFNFYIKIIYLGDQKSILNNIENYKDLYGDLNKYNSKYILDEMFDEKYLNILITNISSEIDNKKEINGFKMLYNKDIKNHIFALDFDSIKNSDNENFVNLFNFLIHFKSLNNHNILEEILNKYNFSTLYEFIKLENSAQVKFYKMIGKILYDLDKINKIYPNYESSRNIDMIKQKVKNNLNEIFFSFII